jgi:hypothetical protein
MHAWIIIYDLGVMFGLRLEQISMYQVHVRLVM